MKPYTVFPLMCIPGMSGINHKQSEFEKCKQFKVRAKQSVMICLRPRDLIMGSNGPRTLLSLYVTYLTNMSDAPWMRGAYERKQKPLPRLPGGVKLHPTLPD